MHARTAIVAAVSGALATVLGGCILITGGTSDYSGEPHIIEAGSAEAASCPPEASTCTQFTCASTADCNPNGVGDGGPLVCCVSLQTSDPIGLTYSCAPSCSIVAVQACALDSHDCGDGGACTSRTCSIGPNSIVTGTCTLPALPFCK